MLVAISDGCEGALQVGNSYITLQHPSQQLSPHTLWPAGPAHWHPRYIILLTVAHASCENSLLARACKRLRLGFWPAAACMWSYAGN